MTDSSPLVQINENRQATASPPYYSISSQTHLQDTILKKSSYDYNYQALKNVFFQLK